MFGDRLYGTPQQANPGRRSSTQSRSTFGLYSADNEIPLWQESRTAASRKKRVFMRSTSLGPLDGISSSCSSRKPGRSKPIPKYRRFADANDGANPDGKRSPPPASQPLAPADHCSRISMAMDVWPTFRAKTSEMEPHTHRHLQCTGYDNAHRTEKGISGPRVSDQI